MLYQLPSTLVHVLPLVLCLMLCSSVAAWHPLFLFLFCLQLSKLI